MHKSIEKILESEEHANRIYDAALFYIANYIPVIPIMRNGKQLPPKATGVNYGSASMKKAVIESWFHPVRGKYSGWNIGIVCGKESGVFAVDLDIKDGENGESNFYDVMNAVEGELPEGPVQLTPSGGKHHLFRWKDGGECTTNKIAKAVDTRGGTAAAYKGHIVAFPSMRDGEMYEWAHWTADIPEIPSWITAITNKEWQTPLGSGRGNELVTSDDIEAPVTKSQMANMLKSIDPNELDYDNWLKIGMAIKSQYPEEDGLEMWEDWSRGGERFKENECGVRWNGFSDFGKVRAGTLFFHAKEGGWQPEKNERGGNKFDQLVAEMNEEYAVVTVGGKIRILREKPTTNEVDMPYDLFDKDSWKTLMENQTLTIEVNDKQKRVPKANIWLGHEGRRTYANGMGLFPDNVVPEGYYNTWNGFSVEPVQGDCSKLLYHIQHVICCGIQEQADWLMDWLADMVQFPADPKGCAVVMRGDEGTGKGMLANTMGKIFGSHHRHLIDDAHLTSNFNAHLLDAVSVFADEITWGGNKKTAGKLKGMVTEKYLVGERKGVDAILYRNMVHLMIASNSEWVIPAGSGSRRWFVLNVSSEMKSNRSYFNALAEEMRNGGVEAFLYYLLNMEIKSDLRRAIETQGLQDQRILNTQSDTILHWWRKCVIDKSVKVEDLNSNEIIDWPTMVGKISLYECYEAHTMNRRQHPEIENVFAKRMLQYGIVKKRVKTKDSGIERVRCYELPDVGRTTAMMNAILPGTIEDDKDDE
jgi:hypothetical protein